MPKEKGVMYFPNYWKVIETSEKKCKVLSIQKETINFEDSDDFFEEVSFIKNKLCADNIGSDGCEEISREKFDAFYKKTVEKINKISIL